MLCQKINTDPLQLPASERQQIDITWQSFTLWRDITEVTTLCRYISCAGDTVSVATDVTYQDVVGLRWQRDRRDDPVPFQVVSALAIIRTSDNQLVLIPRDSGDWPPSLECPGGFIRAHYLDDAGAMDVDSFIKDRSARDLRLTTQNITTCYFLASVAAGHILEHMLVYDIRLDLSGAAVRAVAPLLTILPADYAPSRHHHYASVPLHQPSKNILKEYLG